MTAPRRLILIDDDEDDYILARQLLTRAPASPFSLAWASTFDDGLERLVADDYDACLLDLHLGSKTGFELLREARRRGCRTPIIVLTSHAAHEVDVEAMHLGAVDFLEKQYLAPTVLERSIRYAIERRDMSTQLLFADRLSSLGSLAAGVAHEINNPLAYVAANVAYVADQLPSLDVEGGRLTEVATALREAREGLERIRVIVRDLKTLVRSDEDVMRVLDVGAVLEACLGMAAADLRQKAIVQRDLAPTPGVLANEARLAQVFLNLLINAAQAIPPGHVADNAIRVRTYTDGDGCAIIEISDTGCGMPREVLANVFRPFYSTRRADGGTGLGLSISQGIVLSLGGDIQVRTATGQGSTFTVRIPPAPASAAQGTVGSAGPARGAVRRGRVLIVDDEPNVGNSMARLLARDHDVEACTSGEDALARLRAGPYDVVLCDLTMPGMTGMELYERLRAEQPDTAARMVFITGGVFTHAARQFLDDIPNTRLEKPIESRVLRELIAQRLRPPAN